MLKNFARELKRRRVLHTASLYVVGAWIALQVVEVLASAGLPPATMRNLLLVLSAGFPLAVIAGWFFDISREGITLTGPLPKGQALPDLKFIDHLLLVGLLAVIAVDVWVLSLPPPQNPDSLLTAPETRQRFIAVLDFDDPGAKGEGVGQALAGELRKSLTRVAGLRVLGPESSRLLSLAGESRQGMAQELSISALLSGTVLLEEDMLRIDARLAGVPAGNELWSTRIERPLADAVAMQDGLIEQVVAAVAPGLDPDPAQGPRAEEGDCAGVYDLYLQGKQLASARKHSQAEMYERGLDLLRQVVAEDEQCALAWEALAVASLNYRMEGYVQAGSAARRALELNDTLSEAWSVLADIAANDRRWNDAEEMFLRALYADPTNVAANREYAETLVSRGRARDALHYALEAYRYEPASVNVNNSVSVAALYARDSETVIKHSGKALDLAGERMAFLLDSIAEAYLLRGETERALETYQEAGKFPDWFPDCVRVRDDPSLAPGVAAHVRETFEQIVSGQIQSDWSTTWRLIRCGTWLGEPDIVFGILLAERLDSPYFDRIPTEIAFTNLFIPDAAVLRQHPRFRELVEESGLLDYWKQWGWADLCRPEGDSFACD
jgi:TolB-like protein/Flp pilus assembly protein TadD